jgi:hypothetical protein
LGKFFGSIAFLRTYIIQSAAAAADATPSSIPSTPQQTGSPPSVSQTPTGSASQPTSTPLKRGIANDSSIAAVVRLDSTKHVFFQDINNNIRQAVLTSGNNNDWDVSESNIVVTNARPNTPMAAFLRLYGGPIAAPNEVRFDLHTYSIKSNCY